MGMFGGLQPQRPSIMDDPRLMQMSQVDPRDMASMIADAHARSQLPPDAAPQPPQAAPQPQFTPQPPQGGMMQQGVPAPSPHAYDAAPVIPPSVMSAPDLAGPSSQINPYDMMSMGHDAGARTANIGQQMQPAPAPQSGGGLLGGGGFLGTVGKIGGGILDILKYGPFVAEAHANQRASQQKQQIAYANAQTAYQNANQPSYQTSGDDLIGIPKNGGAPFMAYHGQPKTAADPAGVTRDPVTGAMVYDPSLISPAAKAKQDEQNASDRQDHQDAFQAAMFAHSDKVAAASQAHSDRSQAAGFAHSDAMMARTLGAKADAASKGAFSPEVTAMTAAQVLQGDPAAMANIGRGTQGAQNIASVRAEVVKQGAAMGKTPAQLGQLLASVNLAFVGSKSSARVVGNISGKVDYGVNEMEATAPLALAASAAVPRGKFVPFNMVGQMIDRGNSDPNLAEFNTKTTAFLNAYNLVAARSGTSVPERQHNVAMLSTAPSQEVYARVAKAMMQEAAVTKAASSRTMGDVTRQGAPAPATSNVPASIAAILAKHGAR